MRVVKVWDAEYPWDVRVEKIATALAGAGHEVHLVCRNRRGEAVREPRETMIVHRMPNLARPGSWIEDVSSFPAFVNPRWVRHVLATATQAAVELILCRDLPLAPLAIRVGRQLQVPVIVDLAENYPAMLKHRFHWRSFRPHNVLVRNPWLATLVERHVLRHADAIITVVAESRERVVAAGAPADRTIVVCNTPTRERIAMLAGLVRQRPHHQRLRMVYLGLLGHSRGLGTVFQALRILRDEGVVVEFEVIGRWDAERTLKDAPARMGIADQVRFHGYLPYDEALKVVALADVGVVPHHATEHWRSTIPNKLFDYMAAGIPVLVSDAPPAKRVVQESGAGFVFRDRDPVDLAGRIRQLQSATARDALGLAGRRAVETQYNWDQDGRRLTDLVHRVTRLGDDPASPHRADPLTAAAGPHQPNRATGGATSMRR